MQKANINPGNNAEAGSRDSSPGACPACASVKGEAGKDGAWGNRDRDGLEPGSRQGRRRWLGVNSEGDSVLWVGHQEGLQTGGYERKADEPGEGPVVALNT